MYRRPLFAIYAVSIETPQWIHDYGRSHDTVSPALGRMKLGTVPGHNRIYSHFSEHLG